MSVIGCSKNKFDTPIKEDKLIQILSDIYIGQAYLEGQNPVIKDSVSQKYRQQIFSKYQTNKTDFDTTISIMSRNPKYMEKVYEKVIEKIKMNPTSK